MEAAAVCCLFACNRLSAAVVLNVLILRKLKLLFQVVLLALLCWDQTAKEVLCLLSVAVPAVALSVGSPKWEPVVKLLLAVSVHCLVVR